MGLPNLPMPLVIMLGLCAYCLVTCTLHVLAHRSHMRTRRHDLLVQIKSKRLEYERQLVDRQKALMADYDDGDVNANLVDDDMVAGRIARDTGGERRRAA